MFRKPVFLRWKKRLGWGFAVGLMYSGLLGVAAVVIARPISHRFDVPLQVSIYVAVFVILVASWGLTTIHELGHAGVAVVLRWRVSAIATGPLILMTKPLRVRLGTPLGGSILAGATIVVPLTSEKTRARFMAIFAGGALANFAIGISILTIVVLFGTGRVLDSPPAFIGMLSLAQGMFNLVPYSTRAGGRSDGGAILDYLRGHDPEVRLTMMRILDASIQGQRPRDWNPALIAALKANAGKPGALYGNVQLYNYYFDKGEIENARAALNQAIESIGRTDALLTEDALLAGFGEADITRAETVLKDVKLKRARRTPDYLTVEALLWLQRNDFAEAARKIWLARKALQKWPLVTDNGWELLDAIETRITRARAAAGQVLPALPDASTGLTLAHQTCAYPNSVEA